jgi:hypothetical protein
MAAVVVVVVRALAGVRVAPLQEVIQTPVELVLYHTLITMPAVAAVLAQVRLAATEVCRPQATVEPD